MLWTICVILLILWLLGLVSGYTMGGVIHILLVIAIIVVLVRVIQGTKNIVAIWTLAGEGEVFGKEVVSRSGKILPNLRIPSVEKVSQSTISPQTYREE